MYGTTPPALNFLLSFHGQGETMIVEGLPNVSVRGVALVF
jgi:hypothetical protein